LTKQFLKANGVRHITAVPYQPSSNELAEQAIQACKAAINKMSSGHGTLETKVHVFAQLSITPQELQGYHLLNC